MPCDRELTHVPANMPKKYTTRAMPPEDRRQYVTVETVTVHEPGTTSWVEPHAVRWHDGRRWEIERLYGHEAIGAENGVEVMRWRVQIAGQPKYLYKAKDWFVVPKTPRARVP